jgi:hypothetical protein
MSGIHSRRNKEAYHGPRNNHIYNMKCLDCICGIETPDGVWCVRFKCIPDRKTARKCRNFLSRSLIEGD